MGFCITLSMPKNGCLVNRKTPSEGHFAAPGPKRALGATDVVQCGGQLGYGGDELSGFSLAVGWCGRVEAVRADELNGLHSEGIRG